MQDLKTQLEYEKIKNDDLSKKITELENIIKKRKKRIKMMICQICLIQQNIKKL